MKRYFMIKIVFIYWLFGYIDKKTVKKLESKRIYTLLTWDKEIEFEIQPSKTTNNE